MFVVKECTKCKEYKMLDEFSREKKSPFGRHSNCRQCMNLYKENNKDKLRELRKAIYRKKKEIGQTSYQKYYAYYQQYRVDNKERIKKYKEDNRARINYKVSERRKNNEDYYKKAYEYVKKRCSIDSTYKLKEKIRRTISTSLYKGGYTKRSRTHQVLGCSYEEFKSHIESQFTKGMTWDNYGEWHLDHIIPVSLAKDEQHLIELNHYTNFQPLWAKENLSKGNKIVEKQLKLL